MSFTSCYERFKRPLLVNLYTFNEEAFSLLDHSTPLRTTENPAAQFQSSKQTVSVVGQTSAVTGQDLQITRTDLQPEPACICANVEAEEKSPAAEPQRSRWATR